ncbi:MAG: cytidine deaminase [Kiritimatiellia bacterium]
MNEKESKLIENARCLIKERFKENYHHIASSLVTRSGKEFTAVHLEANVGRVAVCAEAIAIGMAAAAGDTEIETIVAVNRNGDVVSPCGMCRELISDYSPNSNVIVENRNELISVSVKDLLPNKYARKHNN